MKNEKKSHFQVRENAENEHCETLKKQVHKLNLQH